MSVRHATELSDREARQASMSCTYSSVLFLRDRPGVRARNALTTPSSISLREGWREERWGRRGRGEGREGGGRKRGRRKEEREGGGRKGGSERENEKEDERNIKANMRM